jgi:vitamin B12 transporter
MAQSKKTTTALTLASLLALPAPAALAQTTLPEIVIYANQTPTEAGKVGSTVTVLRGTELLAKGFVRVADALRVVPGVSVSQAAGRGSFTQVRVRGAEANHLLVMVDDVPVNDITDGDFNFADFPLEDIDRIEVIRGPQSGLYGANAHAGVISIVTKSGRGLARPEAHVRVEAGSMRTGSVSASARGANGPAYGSVSVDFNQTDGYNVAMNGSERDGSRGLAATAKVGADITRDLNIEGFVRYVRRHSKIDPQMTFGPFEGLAFDSIPDFNNFENLAGRVAATWKMFDGALIQRLSASRFQQSRDDDDIVFGYFKSSGHRDRVDYKATLTGQTNVVGGEKHNITFSADRQNEFLTIDSASFMFDPAAAVFWADGARRTRTGIAGEYSLDLPTGLTVTGALRYDWNSGFENVATWRTTASQRLPSDFRLHASAGTGVTNPTFIEQYGFFTGSFIGNPALKPEQSFGWDVGIEHTALGGSLITDVTFFSSRFEDKIVLVGNPSTPINLPGISPRQGVEVSARYRPFEWLTLTGAYTYTDSRLSDGTPEIRRPRHSASGSATATFADGRGRATVNVIYNGAMTDTWFLFPSNPIVTLAAYTVVGGIISYDLTPATTVFVRAENIFDEQYSDVFSYRGPGFAAYAGMKVKLGIQ